MSSVCVFIYHFVFILHIKKLTTYIIKYQRHCQCLSTLFIIICCYNECGKHYFVLNNTLNVNERMELSYKILPICQNCSSKLKTQNTIMI